MKFLYMIFKNLPLLISKSAYIFIAYLPSWFSQMDKFWDTLSETEQKQANAYIRNSHRFQYVCTRGILRYLLSYYEELHPDQLKFIYNPFGKPFITKSSLKLEFNISHSGDYAAFILGLNHPIGVDIELIDSKINHEALASIVFTQKEYKFYQTLSPQKKIIFFYSIWTQKEAAIKALGCGLSIPLDEIQITPICISPREKTFTKIQNHKIFIQPIYTPEHYLGAAAFIKNPQNIHYFFLRNL